MKQVSAAQLATILSGELEGDSNVMVSHPAKIEEAGPGSIAFLGNPKYEHFAYTTQASVLLVGRDFEPKEEIASTLIRVENVYASVAILLEAFGATSDEKKVGVISDKAFVHPNAQIGEGVSIGHFAIIEAGAVIGAGSEIHPQVFVGADAKVGDNCILYPGVKVYHECVIGHRCIIHSNSVIGSDGFGFAPQADGSYKKIAQVGNVVLEDDIEIGSCTVVDRATMGSTILRQGVKLDNLVQIAHNVEVGAHTVMAAQSAVAGSSKVGAFSQMGGQSGVSGHIQLPNGLKVAAQTGVMTPPDKEGAVMAGTPGMPFKDFMRSTSVFKKLPDLNRRLELIEKIVNELNNK